MIEQRLEDLKHRVEIAAHRASRSLEDISIVCVTKQARLEDVVEVVRAGFFCIGENRIQVAEEKFEYLKKTLSETEFSQLRWHLIGHLQSNKVAKAVKMFDMIQSVDSLKLAQLINSQAQKAGKPIDILVQPNISEEESKHGASFEKSGELIKQINDLKFLNLKGLMGIGPFTDDQQLIRSCFRKLAGFYKSQPVMPILSMGMSDDFEIAIEEGSNMIRVGRTIFGG
ncbi:MAG: YggS family pyridoxal phosphate-dependent enzyme [PVC group bacterium]|nr:YggS family pyridoxal phosphate-dependent enzyme [PVC group bacterium]